MCNNKGGVVLVNRRFMVLLAGSFVASVGGWINFLTILNIATWRFGAAPFDLVLLSAALLLPPVLLTRIIEGLVSRYAGVFVIVVALGGTFCTTAALMHSSNFAVFLLVVGLKSAALGFVDPAEMRYVTGTFEGKQQSEAFRLLSLAQSVAKIAAPAAGAAYAVHAGNDHTMQISMILIAAAMLLMLLSAGGQRDAAPQDRKPVTVKVRLDGPLLPLLGCMTLVVAMSAAVNNQFPLMLRERGFDASVLGLLVSCAALGGVSGSLLPLRERAGQTGLGSVLAPAILSAGVFVVIGVIFRLPLHPARFLLAAAFVISGLVGARLRIRSRMYLASHFPSNVAGASATLQSSTLFTQFLAPCGGAALMSFLTAGNVFVTLGVTTAIGLGAMGVISIGTHPLPIAHGAWRRLVNERKVR
jgi:hypothetical protein